MTWLQSDWLQHVGESSNQEPVEMDVIREESSSESESGTEPPISADLASVSEQSSSSAHPTSSSGSIDIQSSCKAKKSAKYKEHWKERYLVWQNEAEGFMTCIVCSENLTSYKVSTLTRHIDRKHKYSKHYSPSKKQRLISNFQKSLAKQQQTLKKSCITQ